MTNTPFCRRDVPNADCPLWGFTKVSRVVKGIGMRIDYYLAINGYECRVAKGVYHAYERKCGFNVPQGEAATHSFTGRFTDAMGIVEVSGRTEHVPSP